MRVLATAVVVMLLLAGGAPAEGAQSPAPPTLPPLSMTCPHHPDVLQDGPGTCPYCKMTLVPVRLDSAFMCPVHTTVIESDRGTCRLCGRQLVPVTVSLTWTCRGEATEHLEPGLCGDGSPRIGKRALRAHGNHNPQHGGQFFMAPDNWHHLEGAHPTARAFRLYLYDDYSRPLPLADLKKVQARVVTEETFDPVTHKTTEVAAFPLRLARNNRYFEARIDPRALPAEMTAKVRFESNADEYRFDFTFDAITKEPAAPTAARPAAAAPAATAPKTAAPPPSAPAPPAAPAASPAPSTVSAVAPQAVPESMGEILRQLKLREGEVQDLVTRGNFAAVWVPAFQAKDLAIALEPHLAHLAPEKRATGEPAITRVVRGAWLLDASGDLGNRQRVEAAYAAFSAAVSDVLTAFE